MGNIKCRTLYKGYPLVCFIFFFMHIWYKHSKYGYDQSIMVTWLAEQSTILFVSWFLLQKMPWFVIISTFGECTMMTKFGCDRSIKKGTLLRRYIKFPPASQLLLEEIPRFVKLFDLCACAINTVSLGAFGQLWRAPYWTAKYVFVCILAYTGGNPKDRFTFYFTHICYKQSKFGCLLSIMKGTSLGSDVPRIFLGGGGLNKLNSGQRAENRDLEMLAP
jgi:hypothetical protein